MFSSSVGTIKKVLKEVSQSRIGITILFDNSYMETKFLALRVTNL